MPRIQSRRRRCGPTAALVLVVALAAAFAVRSCDDRADSPGGGSATTITAPGGPNGPTTTADEILR